MTFSGNMKESKSRGVKDTWESELGYGWTRTGQRRCGRHRGAESTMSVSSDIRFTRRKLSRSCRGCCAAIASLLVLLLLAAVAVYLGHLYLFGDPLNRQTFRGSFVMSGAEDEGRELGAKGNNTRENHFQKLLFDLYQNSELRSCFVSADILALDRYRQAAAGDTRSVFRGMVDFGWHDILIEWTDREQELLMSSWRSSTINTYKPAWNRWRKWGKGYLVHHEPIMRSHHLVCARSGLAGGGGDSAIGGVPETLTYGKKDRCLTQDGFRILMKNNSVEGGTRVHFEVSFEPIFTAVTTGEVRAVAARELVSPVYFYNVTTLPDTLHIEENSAISSLELKETDTTIEDVPTTEAVTADIAEEVRQCSPVTLPLCSHLPYNTTSYPNLVGHQSRDAMTADLVAFRELLDAECSHLAQDFVCQMLQPRCDQHRLIRPCRAYCRAFHAGCGARLPERLRPHFDCSRFPHFFGPGSCISEPDCSGGLQRLALSRRSCDGIPDCAGADDERGCAHCAAAGASPGGGLRCALQARCLPSHLRCDGTPDCPDGSDETGCLWISRSLASWRRENSETTLGAIRSRSGYAVWAERGRDGKICAAPYEHDKRALTSVATSLCRALTFRSALNAEVVPDSEEELDNDKIIENIETRDKPEYVEVVDPFAPEISFVKSECPQRKVIRVTCDNLECGLASARGSRAASGVEGLARSAQPGDWPWHAALLRSHVHACDAALVHPSWLITTASCFQGQPKAEWTARLGTVRIQSTTPWQQEQRIVGMVRSPVEGSMLALVRLEEPVEMTDFVRPLCLPEESAENKENSICNTLGWTRNRDQLQRVHVVTSPMNTCENVSIATVNGICAEPLYDQDDCDEEEYAGSSMMCFNPKSKRWSLVGVSGWRIACSKIGLGRPRIYDAIASHVDWIRRTISNAAR